MEFQIPETAEGPLADFIKLTDAQASKLVDAIRASQPALRIDDFAKRVASMAGLTTDATERVVSVFASMYLARIDAGAPVDEFVSDLCRELKDKADKQLSPSDWDKFAANIRTVLSSEDSLGVSAKALGLLVDHEHSLHSLRLITDVRHVFGADPNSHPKAAVIVHMLNLVFHEIDGMKEIYIALDAADLRKMKAAIERAEIKERNLKKMLEASKMSCLEG